MRSKWFILSYTQEERSGQLFTFSHLLSFILHRFYHQLKHQDRIDDKLWVTFNFLGCWEINRLITWYLISPDVPAIFFSYSTIFIETKYLSVFWWSIMFLMLRKLMLIAQPKFPCKPCIQCQCLTLQSTVKRSKSDSAILRITMNWTKKYKEYYHALSNADLLWSFENDFHYG